MIKIMFSLSCFMLGAILFFVSTKFFSPNAVGETDKLVGFMLLIFAICLFVFGSKTLIPKNKYPRGRR